MTEHLGHEKCAHAAVFIDAIVVKVRDGQVALRFRYHGEQCPIRPVQLQAARLPPLHDGELVAGLPRSAAALRTSLLLGSRLGDYG